MLQGHGEERVRERERDNQEAARKLFMTIHNTNWGTAVAQWLRCCATNRKAAGSIPDGVIGIFH